MQKKKCRLLSYFFVFVFLKKVVLSTQKKAKKWSFYRFHQHKKRTKTNYLHFPFCIKNGCLQLFFCFVFFCSCFSIWKDIQFFFVVFVLNSFGLLFFFFLVQTLINFFHSRRTIIYNGVKDLFTFFFSNDFCSKFFSSNC